MSVAQLHATDGAAENPDLGSHERPTSGASADTPMAADLIMEEVDRIIQSHRTELHEGMQRWAKMLQTVQPSPLQNLPSLKEVAAMPDFGTCAPPDLVFKLPAEQVPIQDQAKDPSDLQLPPKMAPSHSTTSFLGETKKTANSLVSQVACSKKKKSKRKGARSAASFLAPKDVSLCQQTLLQRMTTSRYYEWASGILIVLNAVFIGWQTQTTARDLEATAARSEPLPEGTPVGYVICQGIFTLLFCIELGLRWVCSGLVAFFQESDVSWNVLDVFVVGFSTVDLLMQFAMAENDVIGSLSVIRCLRVVRIVRVVRVIRVLRFFRELRMMVFSIIGSMKSLMWVILVLAMTFYIFGIIFTAAASSALDTTAKWLDADTLNLRLYFGTLDRSFLSLFMAMSGGNDWSVYYDAMAPLPAQYKFLFLIFISFAIFAVVNIVTGVFVESAMQSNSKDRDIIVHEEMQSKVEYLRSMREIFDDMDDDDTGSITIEEFEAKLDDERVIAYFNAMKLDVSDARVLFWLLDYDQSQEVNIDEFLTGCYKLQGESRSLDMKLMQCEVRFLRQSFSLFSDTLNTVRRGVSDLQLQHRQVLRPTTS